MWPGGTSKVGRSPGPACSGVWRVHRRPGAGNQLQIQGCAGVGVPSPRWSSGWSTQAFHLPQSRGAHPLPQVAPSGLSPLAPARLPHLAGALTGGPVCRLQGQGPRPLLAWPLLRAGPGPPLPVAAAGLQGWALRLEAFPGAGADFPAGIVLNVALRSLAWLRAPSAVDSERVNRSQASSC